MSQENVMALDKLPSVGRASALLAVIFALALGGCGGDSGFPAGGAGEAGASGAAGVSEEQGSSSSGGKRQEFNECVRTIRTAPECAERSGFQQAD